MMNGSYPKDSILSLLDHSWYSQSILNHSVASGVPSVESSGTSPTVVSEPVLRSSEVDDASGTPSSAAECSTLQPVDYRSHWTTSGNSGSEWRRYSIDKSEMRAVFNRFDSNGDGLISGEELHRYMRCCGTDVSDVEVNSMISCVDLNNDGSVDFEEFLLLYQTYYSGDAAEDDERNREDEQEDLLKAFRVFNRSHDGFISAQELQAVLLNLGMPEGKSLISCEEMIRNVDRDGDGRCDIREFQEMMFAKPF